MKASVHQFPKALAGGGASQGVYEGVPLKFDFRIGGQACDIDQPFGFSEGSLIKRRNARGETVHKRIELRVRQGAVHISVLFRQVGA